MRAAHTVDMLFAGDVMHFVQDFEDDLLTADIFFARAVLPQSAKLAFVQVACCFYRIVATDETEFEVLTRAIDLFDFDMAKHTAVEKEMMCRLAHDARDRELELERTRPHNGGLLIPAQ